MRWEKASRSPESISLSTTKHRLLHTLSARRASFLAAAIIFFLQRQFGHTGRAFCLRGACLLSNEDHLVLNCSSRPSAVEAGFKMRGSFKISALNRSVSILLMDLKKTVSLALIFRWARIQASTESWSFMRLEAVQHATSLSDDREMIRSRVCPSIWVGPRTCCWRSKWSSNARNRWDAEFSLDSTWMLKSPALRTFPHDVTTPSRKQAKSSMNWPILLEGGRYRPRKDAELPGLEKV